MRRRGKLILALALCIGVFLVSAGVITVRLISEYKSDRLNEALRELAETPMQTNTSAEAEKTDNGPTVPASPYDALYKLNQDFFGWLSIPGTSIDYPVMYTPCDPEYYIDKDFNRSRDANGTLFLDGLCIPEYSNLILYGHNMKSGRMFGTLEKFKDKSYYEEHPIIRFDTLEQQGTYEIFAVFITEVYTRDSNEFKFYDYTELSTRADFDIFMENIRNLRLYDTEVEAQYGDRFLTLATCDYSRDNGRFVVVAKKIGNCP